MNKELIAIFDYMEREKGIKRDVVVKAIEEAMEAAAYKSMPGAHDLTVTIEPRTGDLDITCKKEIVDSVNYPAEEISLEEAQELHPEASIGDYIQVSIDPQENFGRIAASAARQMMTQKLRGAERDVIYEEYRHRICDIVSGTVKRFIRSKGVIVDLGKIEAVMPTEFYPRTERYHTGDRVQALLYEVRDTENGGAEVILSRSAPEFVRELFISEVPELTDGIVSIERICRDGGYRTKMAVATTDPRVDPVGACVGVRGTRVKNVIRELNNEKIDIFPYSEDPIELLQNSLDPIEIKKFSISEEDKTIICIVDDEDYPLVIGKRGANLRLNETLTGYHLQIQKETEYNRQMQIASDERMDALKESEDGSLDEELSFEGVNPLLKDSLVSAGFTTLRKILSTSKEEICEKANISLEALEKLTEQLQNPEN
jgi:transcription termination/antitermination protein NusA